jgi:hypothetical protein
MGDYDMVVARDPRLVCSEGHDVTDEGLQTKDLGCTMGHAEIVGDKLLYWPGHWGEPLAPPVRACLRVCCTCRRCPAFIQRETLNVVGTWVEFEIDVVDDEVRSITRVSESTAEFLENEPRSDHMQGCLGPMPYEAAYEAAAVRRSRSNQKIE